MPSTQSQARKAEWEIVHWPIKCRGNFIRLVFAECGIPFKETAGFDVASSLIRSTKNGAQKPHPKLANMSMAPPYIRKIGDVFNTTMINQCVVATQYLAELYGLRPKSDLSHAQCGMIIANCNDAFTEVYHAAGAMRDKKMNSQEFINDFFLKRFPIWLEIIGRPLARDEGQRYYFENRITQSDLAVYNVMEGFNEWLGDKLFKKYVLEKHPLLAAHFKLVRQTSKGVQQLTKQQNEIGYMWWPYASKGGLSGSCPFNDALYIRRSREILMKSKL